MFHFEKLSKMPPNCQGKNVEIPHSILVQDIRINGTFSKQQPSQFSSTTYTQIHHYSRQLIDQSSVLYLLFCNVV